MGIHMINFVNIPTVLSPGKFVLPNKGWELGVAGDWVFTDQDSDAPPSVSSANPRSGSYHLRMNGSQNDLRWQQATYTVTAAELALLKGKTATFSVWVKDTLVDGYGFGTPTGYIRLNDGVGNSDASIAYGSYWNWTQLSVSRAISASATTVQFILYTNPAQQNLNRDSDDMDVAY